MDSIKFFKKYWYHVLLTIIVLLGIFLRSKGLLANPTLWHDEAALGWNTINKSYLGLFDKLRFLQIAPPLFMVLTKFLIQILHGTRNAATCDFIMRIIPFICGILSIGIFYKLCQSNLNSRKALLTAMFLFSINQVLINYSFEFKQYSSDMLLILLIVLVFQNFDFNKTTYKKLCLMSSAICLSVWFSFISIFATIAEFVLLCFKKGYIKKKLILFLPFTLNLGFYAYFYLLNTYQKNQSGMINYWKNEFVAPNFSNFFRLFLENIQFFFTPTKCLLFIVILTLLGSFIFLKERKTDFISVTLLIFSFTVIASIFHIYPFSKRLIIFLIPFFIILLTKPLDKINKTKPLMSLTVIFMTFAIIFPQLLSLNAMLKIKHISKGSYSREMITYLSKNIKPEDSIFVNNASIPDFLYYSSFYKIKNKTIIKPLNDNPNEEYKKILMSQKGKVWFFLAYNSQTTNSTMFILDWLKTYGIIEYINGTPKSTLIYAKMN